MGLFHDDYKTKFWKLISVIDERLRIYEMLTSGNPDKVPPGLATLRQEFRNLKIKCWSIEKGDDVVKLIKDFKQEEVQQQIDEEGDLK